MAECTVHNHRIVGVKKSPPPLVCVCVCVCVRACVRMREWACGSSSWLGHSPPTDKSPMMLFILSGSPPARRSRELEPAQLLVLYIKRDSGFAVSAFHRPHRLVLKGNAVLNHKHTVLF